jgi:hypothetical protein
LMLTVELSVPRLVVSSEHDRADLTARSQSKG